MPLRLQARSNPLMAAGLRIEAVCPSARLGVGFAAHCVWLAVLAVGALFGQAWRCGAIAGVFIAHSPLFKRLLKHHPFGQMQAVAVGCCVLASDTAALNDCLAHELVHVEQVKRWGMVFPLAYMASSLWQGLNGRCPYADNWFERQANRVQAP